MKKLKGIVAMVCLLFTAEAFLYAGGAAESGKRIIGISKIVSHPALDAVEQGIQDQLKADGFTDITFDLQNANGDVNTAASIANKFKSEKVAVAVGIATPMAVSLANVLKDTPVVYSAVTDPVSAGLVKSFTKGEKFVTGVSDMTPVKEQIAFLTKLKPIKRLGHIYTSSEANAVVLRDMTKKACDELGIEFVESAITNSSEVKQAAQSIASRVDAFYVSTDNTVVSAITSLTDVAMANKLPVVSADPSSAESNQVLVAWGFDYYKIGRATGRVIGDILKGKSCEEIPTLFMTAPSDIDLLINEDVAAAIGITIPKDILDSANKIVRQGKLITK